MTSRRSKYNVFLILLAAAWNKCCFAGQPRFPDTYEDDIYHCDNPDWVDTRKSIECNEDTFMWEVSQLTPDEMPEICGDDYVIEDEITDVPDWEEPCVLWEFYYGNLMPTTPPTMHPSLVPSGILRFLRPLSPAPSLAPADLPTVVPQTGTPSLDNSTLPPGLDDTLVPASAPTLAPVSTQPPSTESQNEPPSGSPPVSSPTSTENDSTDIPFAAASSLPLEPIVLTFVWQSDDASVSDTFSLDRTELYTITSRHILEALQAELGVAVVVETNLVMTFSVPSEPNRWSETVAGEVVFSRPDLAIDFDRLQRIVKEAFIGNAHELFQFRLQIAKDPTLRSVSHVIVGTEVPTNFSPPTGAPVDSGESDGPWGAFTVAIAASVAAAIVAVCCFAYCLLCRSSKSQRRQKANSSRTVPAIDTKSTDEEERAGTSADEEDGPEEDQSVGTSVYSYLNDDMSLSAAPSFLYSINEADVSKDEDESEFLKRQKKGLLWSVMDTLQTHFADDSDNENRMLGPASVASDSAASNSLLYDDDNKSFLSANMDRILTTDDASAARLTPVKKQFEELWKEDDEENAIQQVTPQQQKSDVDDVGLQPTVKKSNRAGQNHSVYEDEETTSSHGQNGSTYDDDDDEEEEEEPTHQTPLDVQPAPRESAPVVDRLPRDRDETKLPLPSALSSSASPPNQENNEVSSLSSKESRHSASSGRSSGSEHLKNHPQKGGSIAGGSARKKKSMHSWNSATNLGCRSDRSVQSVHSVKSTDSAKFRSLLGQADTNDAALFYNHSERSAVSVSSDSPSPLPTTKPISNSKPTTSSLVNPSGSGVASLINSFNKAWGDDHTPNKCVPQPSLLQTSQESLLKDEHVGAVVEDSIQDISSATQTLNDLLADEVVEKRSIDGQSFDGVEEELLPFETTALDKSTSSDDLSIDVNQNYRTTSDTMASF